MRRWARRVAALCSCVAMLFVSLAELAPQVQAGTEPVFTVMNTSETLPDGVWFRNSPHTSDTDRVTGHGVYMNEQVQLQCYAWGDAVGPYDDTLWYFVLNVTRPINAGVTNSGYLNAHYINDGLVANQIDAGVTPCTSPSGISEQEGHNGVNTFTNYHNASGLGPTVPAAAWVQITCKVYDPTIASANPDGYWYLIASSPWDNAYYAPANTFMNGDPWGGPYTHNTDYSVPDCSNAPAPGSPSVSLAQGPAASVGYWYAVSVAGFPANSTVYVVCYDSVTTGGWEHFAIHTNGAGSGAIVQGSCLSGDGPDHWVVVNGVYQSNHVQWGAGSSGGTSHISTPAAGDQGSTPQTSTFTTTCSVTLRPVNCATGDFWHTFADFSVPGPSVPLQFTHTYTSSSAGTSGPLDFGWTDSYDMSLSTDSKGNVIVVEEDGSTVTYASNGDGTFTGPSWVLATLVSNPDGTYTFKRDATQVQYVFSPYGQLLREVDRNGYATSLGYSGDQLTSITDPAGRSLTLTYAGSQISQITDPLGRSESFTYDAAGNLVSETTPTGGVWSFTYDPNHLLLTMTDPRGGVTTNVYDASDRVISQTDPAGLTTTWSYAGTTPRPWAARRR